MTTTGEFLVLMSTLAAGKAIEHFTNISYGGVPITAGDGTPYGEASILALLFRNVPFAGIGTPEGIIGSAYPGYLYVTFLDTNEDEISYPAYNRVPVARDDTGWEAKDEGEKNKPVLTWPPNDGPDLDIQFFAIMDSLINGNMLFKKELPVPVEIKTGNQAQFNYNQLSVKII